MIVYIVRHAWAGQSGDPRYPDDALRPLSEKGHRRFRRMVKKLARRGFDPALVATSPLLRARQTAELIERHAPRRPGLEVLDALAPGGEIAALVEWSARQVPLDLAWVGHAPDVDHLAAELIGARAARISFQKGAVAAIHFQGPIEPGQGELAWLATAELLRC